VRARGWSSVAIATRALASHASANAAYQCCRRRRRPGADVSLDKLLPVFDEHGRHVVPVADWSMIVDDPARQTELRMALSTAIDELPADYRAAMVLRDVEGLSYRDIAQSLGLTVPTVRMRVHRARLFLRKRLDAYLSIADVESMPSAAAADSSWLTLASRTTLKVASWTTSSASSALPVTTSN
jgi:RNA polymerase sigma factor (sigma-70 family)